jgi:hypothetical protein
VHEVLQALCERPDTGALLPCLPIACLGAGTSNGIAQSYGMLGDHLVSGCCRMIERVLEGSSSPLDVISVRRFSAEELAKTSLAVFQPSGVRAKPQGESKKSHRLCAPHSASC